MNPLHLTAEEEKGLEPAVVKALNKAFVLVGFKPRLTSLFRTRAQGAALGSLPTSAHERGLAGDMSRPIGVDEAVALAFALGYAGFPRLEIADKHFHVDMDGTKTSPLIWKGESK